MTEPDFNREYLAACLADLSTALRAAAHAAGKASAALHTPRPSNDRPET